MPSKVVEVPGIGNIEFPDSMTDDQISAAIQKQAGGGEKSVGGFLSNVATSAKDFAGNLAGAVTHPLDTAKAIGAIPVGLAEKAGIPTGKVEPGQPSAAQQLDAIMDHFKGRYGSFDGAKKALYEDPVGVLGDVSTVLDGAGVAADAAKLGKVATAAKTAGEFTNPVSLAGKAVAPVAKAAGNVTKDLLVKDALKSGYQVNTDAAHLGAKVDESAAALLNNGINFSQKGLTDLKGILGNLQQSKDGLMLTATQQGGATVDPGLIVRKLQDLRAKWATQAYPDTDLKQIDRVIKSVQDRHPYPLGLDEAEALKEGTYANNKYGDSAPPPHLAATAAAEQNVAHTLMAELERQIPELGTLNAQQAKLLGLEPMLAQAITKYRNSGGFASNLIDNLRSKGALGGDALAGMLGFGLSHGDPVTGAVAGGSAALMQAVLSDPAVKTKLALAIHAAQQADPGKYGAATMANAFSRINAYGQRKP